MRTQGIEKTGIEYVAYEREPLSIFNLGKDDDPSDFHICEIRMTQQRKSYMGLFSNIQSVGYSRLHLFRKEWTVKQVKLRVYELMRPLIKNPPRFKQ